MLLTRTIFLALVCSFFVNGQTESFKLTFNHQALPVKQLQKTGDSYIENSFASLVACYHFEIIVS